MNPFVLAVGAVTTSITIYSLLKDDIARLYHESRTERINRGKKRKGQLAVVPHPHHDDESDGN